MTPEAALKNRHIATTQGDGDREKNVTCEVYIGCVLCLDFTFTTCEQVHVADWCLTLDPDNFIQNAAVMKLLYEKQD